MRERHPSVTAAIESGVDPRIGWQLADPRIEADAKALWARTNALPPGVDPDERAKEIVVATYIDGQMAGVSTAVIREIAFLRANFAMFRAFVAPEHRLRSILRVLMSLSLDHLERWSLEHPEVDIAGMASVTQNEGLSASKRWPIVKYAPMVLVGYTKAGERIRVGWFDHVRV